MARFLSKPRLEDLIDLMNRDPRVRPVCDHCNRPVEKLVTAYSALHASQLIAAVCHGETEIVELPDFEFVLMKDFRDMEFGRAFVRKQLNQPSRQITA